VEQNNKRNGEQPSHGKYIDGFRAKLDQYLLPVDPMAIDIVLSTAISIYLRGDPIWLLLIGPSGGGKTELLNLFKDSDDTLLISRLTENTLLSGSLDVPSGHDLLDDLNGKILIIKDLSPILELGSDAQKSILSTLRDAYDGHVTHRWGTGVTKEWQGRFGVMAAATYAVDKQMTLSAELGERFVRVNLKTDSLEQTKRALELIGREEEMRDELSKMGRDLLAHYKRLAEDMKPAIPGSIIQLVQELAVMTATLRTPVLRDGNHVVTTPVVPEVGTRLGKQLSQITQAHALLWEKKRADRIDYTFTVRAAIDSIRVQRVNALRILLDGEYTGKNMAGLLSVPPNTLSYVMQDLKALGIVEKMGGHKGWRLNDSAHEVLKRTGMVGAIR